VGVGSRAGGLTAGIAREVAVALKTQPTRASVAAFLNAIPDGDRRADCRRLAQIMRGATRARARMWGTDIVGFGNHHYRYDSGREGDWFLVGFSPRKAAITIYLLGGFDRHPPLLRRLGKHKAGRGCLYVKQLADVDLGVLTEIIEVSVAGAARDRG
jgi:hypothetical protein